jgi:hypothetical protein
MSIDKQEKPKLPPLPKNFLALYGDKGKATHGQRMRSKAIRAEWPGGNELVDAFQNLEEIFYGCTDRVSDGTFAKLVRQKELLVAMWEAAAAEIIRRYEAGEIPARQA